jgi:membrane protease YdiL (CAAX protease family)
MGLEPRSAERGLRAGVFIGLPVAALIAAAAFFPLTRKFFEDEGLTIARSELSEILHELAVRMPLATAAGEELIFRSALEGVFGVRRSAPEAVVASTLMFGAWHALPTLAHLRAYPGARAPRHSSPVTRAVVVAAHCGVTAAAGLALSGLRRWTGSILTPVIVHYAINGGAFAGSWLAAARRRSSEGPGTAL